MVTAAILKLLNAISQQPSILMNFGTAMHIGPANLKVDQKFQNFKIQDGGRQPS